MRGILLEDGCRDLCVGHGELAIGETNVQVTELVLLAFRGEFKEFPALGGEIKKQMGGTVDVMWPGTVKRMLGFCGVPVGKIVVDGDMITLQ